MGSDNSGKPLRPGRLLVPVVILVIIGMAVFILNGGDMEEASAEAQDMLSQSTSMLSHAHLPEFFHGNLRHMGPLANREGEEEVKVKVDNRPIASIDHIVAVFTKYLRELHLTFSKVKILDNPEVSAEGVWEKFKDLTVEHLLPLDTEFKLPPVDPSGNTVFLSVAAYRDENCPNTIKEAYEHADNPQGLYVGLVEQNCYANCRTGVLKDGSVRDAPPDLDCYKTFCDSAMGELYCDHIRILRINESESLGPAMARYFASKLWHGESYYLQIDAHSFFAKSWDTDLKQMVLDAERPKAIITDYPPPEGWAWQGSVGLRMCDGFFTEPGIEAQIVRLEGSSQLERTRPATPRFAPYMAAGFFFVSGTFLHEVPFDPFLPYIFMGEEILLSSRAFTNGYHIFSPTINVLAHIYVRRNKPKFWETVGRAFKRPGFHNRLNAVVIRRVKNILGYPENDDELLWPQSLKIEKDRYGMGKQRTLQQYLDMVGLDPVAKTSKRLDWCHKGETPPQLLESS